MTGLYTITAILTLLIGGLGYLLWRKTQSLNFAFGAAALYFWSIHGAWALNYDKTVGSKFLRYHYLESRLFTIELDEAYFMSVLLLGLFCVSALVTALLFTDRSKSTAATAAMQKICVSHLTIITISLIAAVLAYLVIATAFTQAVILGQTGYSAIASEAIRFFTIHQLLNRLAFFSAVIGFAICVSGDNNRYVKSKSRKRYYPLYLLLLLGLTAYLLVLGNKNELFTGVVLGLLFYLGTHTRPPIRSVMVFGAVMLLLVGSVDYLRNFALLSGETNEIEATKLLTESSQIIFSNEAISAHMSMYGALKFDIPPSNGNGINALIFSVIPTDLWPDRPVGNYRYYTEKVSADSGIGYTIHHATSWYLDFGIIGVALGGTILGLIWAGFHNGFSRLDSRSSTLRSMFFILAPFGFTAYFPVIIRAGVEVYKGTLLGAIFLPLAMMLFAWLAGRWFEPVNSTGSAVTNAP